MLLPADVKDDVGMPGIKDGIFIKTSQVLPHEDEGVYLWLFIIPKNLKLCFLLRSYSNLP